MFQVMFTPDRRLMVRRRAEDDRDTLPVDSTGADTCTPEEGVYIYEMAGCRCMAREIDPDSEKMAGCRAISLRESWSQLPRDQYRMACKGAELLNHDRQSRYCGRCGGLMRRGADGLSKACESCGAELFPHISPCIIVLVRRGDEALLVHARTFRGNHYGLVAGFVETGETLEECVAREVREETSLDICNVRYEGSQPWPFPANLMLGFTADYAGGELRFADGELTSGGFFAADNLPPLPTGASIARMMINKWAHALRDSKTGNAESV